MVLISSSANFFRILCAVRVHVCMCMCVCACAKEGREEGTKEERKREWRHHHHHHHHQQPHHHHSHHSERFGAHRIERSAQRRSALLFIRRFAGVVQSQNED